MELHGEYVWGIGFDIYKSSPRLGVGSVSQHEAGVAVGAPVLASHIRVDAVRDVNYPTWTQSGLAADFPNDYHKTGLNVAMGCGGN